jgi:hypothetical protein
MEIIEVNEKLVIGQNKKFITKFTYFEKLIGELKKREIPSEIVSSINQNIEEVNSFIGSTKDLKKRIRKSQYSILKLIEKELKIVPKNLYRTRWMAIGMSAFGVPMGVAFGASLGNMAYLAIGIPIGMAIGMAIGASMDKKAFDEGKQLDLEINY